MARSHHIPAFDKIPYDMAFYGKATMSLQDLPLSIADALEHFNKAEPDLMVRDAFGHRQKRLCLATSFRERLESGGARFNTPGCVVGNRILIYMSRGSARIVCTRRAGLQPNVAQFCSGERESCNETSARRERKPRTTWRTE